MKLTLVALAFLMCSSQGHDSRHRFSTGVQTFEASRNESEIAEAAPTSIKPLPQTYTVVDWKRYYPFGDKFPDANATNTANDTNSANSTDPPGANGDKLVMPVYIKVPIRVPVKAYRKTRTIRAGKSVKYPYRYVIAPRFMMVRHLPMRRKFITYYPKSIYYKRRYIKPVYQKTGIHDLYQKNVYYKLRGQGYEVREPEGLKNFYESRNELP